MYLVIFELCVLDESSSVASMPNLMHKDLEDLRISQDEDGDTMRMARRSSRSPSTLAELRVKNRRKRYLDIHPEYFSSSLELAGPLL